MWKILLISGLLLLSQPNLALAQNKAIAAPSWEAIEAWISTLSDEQRLVARLKVDAHRAKINDLQARLRQKLAELRSLRYDSRSTPETLPRIGMELQEIRASLRQEYEALNEDLSSTFGSQAQIGLSSHRH